jgi:hypothetical protein
MESKGLSRPLDDLVRYLDEGPQPADKAEQHEQDRELLVPEPTQKTFCVIERT